jgi:methanethiol S-methyltransferase
MPWPINPTALTQSHIMNQPSLFHRTAVLLYGVIAYAVFFVTFCYTPGFVGNFLVPKSIDAPPTTSLGIALLVNTGLLALFAVQHSVMARPVFKRWFTRIIPEAAERSTYTLLSSLALIALFWFWQPMGGIIWQVDNAVGRMLLLFGLAAGWLLVLAVSFMINHFDLFGLRQVWLHFRNRPYTAIKFKTPGLYKYVRHPLYVGWLLLFWCTPTMTVAHLVFAILTTGYILAGLYFEERDLQNAHPEYADYKRNTPRFVPRVVGNPTNINPPAAGSGESYADINTAKRRL